MSDRENAAVNCLQAFFTEMFKWEEETDRLLSSPEVKAMTYESRLQEKRIRRALIEEIFDKYCEVGKNSKRLKGGGLSYGTPRYYDPSFEPIVSVEENKKGNVIVVTRRIDNPVDYRFKYEIIATELRFLIRDNKTSTTPMTPKWSSHLL
jgi:hypothetical protein